MHELQKKARTLKVAARYLGLRGDACAEPGMNALLNAVYARMREVCQPKHRLLRVGLLASPETGEVHIDGLKPVISKGLCRLLAECREGYVLLATLGMDVDMAMRLLMVTDAAAGAALGACGSAYIDVYMDSVLRREAEALRVNGMALTPRFSPGYGDAPLTMQRDILALCGAKTLGVQLTRGGLMLPEKSVTAIMGITREGAQSCMHGCATCEKKDCQFREEEA